MAGIKKVENAVLVGPDSPEATFPWRGSVIDLQYSISFEGSSSLTLTVANSQGSYDIPALNAMNPTRIRFGSADMKMLPVSYRKSRGAGGRTLRVDFEDMSLRYLDKTLVLLKHQHLSTNNVGGCTIVLGKMFADDINGIETRYYGLWKSGLVRVKYDIRDLALGIVDAGVPISTKFYNYLLNFRAYPPFVDENDSLDPPNSFLRTEVGPLRDVLGSVSNELGFVFFWNNADGIDANFSIDAITMKVGSTPNAGEGFLDFVVFKGAGQDDVNVDTNIINQTIIDVQGACNVEDDSYEVSIKDSHIKGGIGFFAVEPTFNVGGASRFKRLKFKETIDGLGESSVNVSDPDVKMLMKAALVGPAFYARYVMQKLTAYYVRNIGSTIYDTLKERTQADPPAGNADPFDRVGPSVTDESQVEHPINTVINTAVRDLYSSEFVLIPCIYSNPYAEGGQGVLSWRESRTLNDDLPPAHEEYGSDDRWIAMFKDDSFMEKLRDTSEFVGVAYTNNLSIQTFLANPDQCPVYQQVKFLAENYGKWYSIGKGSLMVESTYAARTYSKDTSFVFSDLAVTESPIADIFAFTYSKMDDQEPPERVPLSFEEAKYRMVLAGQSNCGGAPDPPIPDVISPAKRTITTEIDRDDGVVESYAEIIGIRAMLKSNLGANAEGGRTGCKGGRDDDDFIKNINDVNDSSIDGFAIETLERRSNTNTDDSGEGDNGGGWGGTSAAKSLTSAGYSKIQEYRSSCDDEDKCPNEAVRTNGEGVCFAYPTDKDYGVVLHDASIPTSTGNIDGELTYANYGKKHDVGSNDLWYKSGSAYFGLEIVQLALDSTGEEEEPVLGAPEERSTEFGFRFVDWWDWQLDQEVTLAAGSKLQAPSSITIGYSYTVDFLMQSLRAAFIPNEVGTTKNADGQDVLNFSQAGSIEVEEVEFQIGEVIKSDTDRFEFPLCDEATRTIDFKVAAANLIKIMKNYVELNISQAISRDFVVSGYGFNLGKGNDPGCNTGEAYLPNIYQGLESISMSLSGDSGVRTTIKIGNKRRKRASAQLRREMIVRNMPMATSRALTPNPVNNAFSVGVQART